MTRPNSTAVWHGRALALDTLAALKKSNHLLTRAIDSYRKAVEFGGNLDNEVFKMLAERCIDRMRFIGWFRFKYSCLFMYVIKSWFF